MFKKDIIYYEFPKLINLKIRFLYINWLNIISVEKYN